jgi:hypothetical protein
LMCEVIVDVIRSATMVACHRGGTQGVRHV